MLRHSPLFHFNHGNHVCVFYRTADALREVLIPYLAEGLRRGERCLCAQNPDLCKQIIYDLRFLGIDTDGAIRRGALEVHTVNEVYFPNKKFEPEKMIELLLRSMEEAWRSGFTALRTAGELSWAAEGRAECDQLLSYEKLVEQIFPGKSAIGLCQYKMDEFPPTVLEGILDAHRFEMSDTTNGVVHAGISIRGANCWTEIVADRLVINPSYDYVVQQRNPREVLGWGTAASFDEAAQRAENVAHMATW
jgi:hypothetical protein